MTRHLCAVLAMCGALGPQPVRAEPPAGPGPASGVHRVEMNNEAPFYSPPQLTVEAGDAVVWVNSRPADPHTIQERGGAFRSPEIPAGESWCQQLRQEGEYVYGCRIHPWMRGGIVVLPRTVPVEEVEGAAGLASARRIEGPPGAVDAVRAPDGRVWFITEARDRLHVLDPGGGARELELPPGAQLSALAVSPEGSVWATDAGRNKVLEAVNGWIYEHTVPTTASEPHGIAVDAEGTVWFAETSGRRIGRLRKGEGIEELLIPIPGLRPTSLRIDGEGNLWLVYGEGCRLAKISAGTLRALEASRRQRTAACPPQAPAPAQGKGVSHAGGH